MLRALTRALRWQKLRDDGRYASINEMAAAEKIEQGYLGKVLQLTLLAPNAVESILDGGKGAELTLPALTKSVPTLWN